MPAAPRLVLPSGTVTFLFTDIESSSEGWVNRPEWMAGALAQHDAAIRAALEANDGIELKHLGDGLCAVFSSAVAALGAAIDAQRRLQKLDWPDGERLRVRMGLHTGEAAPDRDDYFGQTITRAARVMDAANGDQILCSASSRALSAQALATLDGAVALSDVGEVELAGIGMERLFLVRSDSLLVDDRPIRGRSGVSGTLPRNLQSFVGRTDDLSALTDLVMLNRLVTLVGVGGVGKSRLAVELARSLADNHPDGIYWCPLSSLTDPSAVPQAILGTLGATPREGLDPVEGLAAYLDNQKILLILDNCEHLGDAIGSVVRTILDRSNGPTVIATSRRPLRLTGEHVWPVSPLDRRDDQVELFLDRARERDPRFDPTDDEVAAIAKICERLDGLPLAVELAAARVRVMSPIAILDRLDDRFRLLGSSRDGTSRRLVDTVQWSYEQLDPPVARLFRWLSIFGGGFSIDAVESVCAVDDEYAFEVLDHLETLIDDSLVQRDANGAGDRFVMLETLRQFGLDELAGSDQLDAATERYTAYFVAFVEREVALIHSAHEFEAWDALDTEWSNIRAVYSRLSELGDFDRASQLVGSLFYFAGYSLKHEVMEWADECLEDPRSEGHPLLSSLCATAAFGAYCRAALEQSAAACARGLAADPDNGRCFVIAVPANLNGGEVARSAELLDEMFAKGDTLTAPQLFWANVWKALHLAWVQRDEAATDFAQRSLELAARIGSPSTRSAAHMINGVALTQSDPAEAVSAFKAGLALLADHGKRSLIGRLNEEMLADLLAATGPPDEALEACRMALESSLDNDWLISASNLMDATVLSLLRSELYDVAATLAACAVTHEVRLRGRTTQMLSEVESIDELQAAASGLSLRAGARMAIKAIDDHQTTIDLSD